MMSTPDDRLSGLVERLEKSSGPDRELDSEIALYLGWTFQKMKGDGRPYWRTTGETDWFMRSELPFYTSSIDAAMTLVPERFAIRDWMVWPGHPSELTIIETFFDKGQHWHSGDSQRWSAKGATPAIALCIAAMKAKSRGPQP